MEEISGLKGPGGEVKLELTPTQKAGIRLAAAVELTADGQPFGQVAEALVTIGGDAF